MKNALLHRKLDEFGRLLDLEWQHKRRMSPRISSPELDALYAAALESGAIGGKITGAGGGGYMLLYCRFDRKRAVRDKMRELGVWMSEVSLEPLGLQPNRHVVEGARLASAGLVLHARPTAAARDDVGFALIFEVFVAVHVAAEQGQRLAAGQKCR
jgi:galactokinase